MSKEFKPSAPGSGRRSRSRGPIILVVIGLAVFGIWGIVTRIEAASSLKAKTDEYAVPTVAVMSVPEGSVSEEVVLPGNVQAWHEAPIYARTSGYLKKWTADIGAHVKAGEVLAEIETPEVDAQLHQAEADLTTAQA
ncbi:MAG: HlyD family secretion protein, partial [Pseudomonadota bacterium]|nr:HlyD family secretion protein [Pseudomonadota bacterium]